MKRDMSTFISSIFVVRVVWQREMTSSTLAVSPMTGSSSYGIGAAPSFSAGSLFLWWFLSSLAMAPDAHFGGDMEAGEVRQIASVLGE